MTEDRLAITKLLLAFFDGDNDKVNRWLVCENPMFGYLIPANMIAGGRGDKVLKTIQYMLDENARR